MQCAARQYRCHWIDVISRALLVMNDWCWPRGSTVGSRVMDGRPGRVAQIQDAAHPTPMATSASGRYLLVLGFQFWITVIGEALASSGTELITNDWPSGATM